MKSRKAMNCGGICKKPTLDSLDKCILYHTIYYSICLLYFSFYYILLLNAQKLLDRKIKLPILHKTKQLQQSNTDPPTLYVLNAASLAKPHALEQLRTDLCGYNIDIALITETHFKQKHSSTLTNIPGYTAIRHDRKKGGVEVLLYI